MQATSVTDPVELLRADRARAVAAEDPCASLCTVASVDGDGNPAARTLVLRDLDGELAVFSNRTSPKWHQLDGRTSIAVVVWLPVLQVQYRLQCRTRTVPDALVHGSWQLRPEPAKRLDWFYTRNLPQGSAIADRAALVDELAAIDLAESRTAPDTAGGYYLLPFEVDRLDVAQPDGIHDRRRFTLESGKWTETVLVP
jgi:pyridoxine/pyridoxamine 5'-phosphate oxidase